MRATNKLTALQVGRITKAGLYGDGLGLWLQVSKSGTKSWLFRFMLDGKAREMGLGPLHTVSLADARISAATARGLLLKGHDPIESRQSDRAEAKIEAQAAAARLVTFQDCAEQCIADRKAGWKNEKHASQWAATLRTYAYPVIGLLPVGSIDTNLVLQILRPIWSEKTETASRVRGRIETVLDWAKFNGHRDGENPARWRGHLDKGLIPKSKFKKVRHHPAMPYADVPAYMAGLRLKNCTSARALEFTILTAVRTNETIGGKWFEIDDNRGIWTIPADRMKADEEHRVPLPSRARDIISGLHRENDYLFAGEKADRSLSNMAMLEFLQGTHPHLTVHGFRSSFRDWAAEETGHANHVIEMALAHKIKDEVEKAYRRGDLFEKRRTLMADWEAFCLGTAKREVTPEVTP